MFRLAALLAFLLAATPALADIKGTINHTSRVESLRTGANYQVSVYLPADYAATRDKLPVIYVLDGGVDNPDRLPAMAAILEEQHQRAVLVGIGGYARRRTDFLLPGAESFYAFITTELIPFAEQAYRIDPARRTLDGHSFGGYFAMYAMLHEGAPFANVIVHDMISPDRAESLKPLVHGRSGAPRLILSADTKGNAALMNSFAQLLEGQASLQRIPATALGHMEMFEPSFRESVKLLFNSPAAHGSH